MHIHLKVLSSCKSLDLDQFLRSSIFRQQYGHSSSTLCDLSNSFPFCTGNTSRCLVFQKRLFPDIWCTWILIQFFKHMVQKPFRNNWSKAISHQHRNTECCPLLIFLTYLHLPIVALQVIFLSGNETKVSSILGKR